MIFDELGKKAQSPTGGQTQSKFVSGHYNCEPIATASRQAIIDKMKAWLAARINSVQPDGLEMLIDW